MNDCTTLPCNASAFAELNAQGLNLQAVFNMAELPADVLAALPNGATGTYRQLVLIGHRGSMLWQQLQRSGMVGQDPIDRFSQTHITTWLNRRNPQQRFCFVYPGPTMVGLQRLGTLAGWHHPSPFMVGIDAQWGSWFAYRAVVLADTDLPPTVPRVGAHPCDTCSSRVCVSACPAGALAGAFDVAACMAYRSAANSRCQDRCVARNACPVGAEHRYSDEQIRYHYGQSLQHIQKMRLV